MTGETVLSAGERIFSLAQDLYPICRSITGDGVRETLSIIQQQVPIDIHEVPSGTRVFDWTVPDEWNISDAWIDAPDGSRVVSFTDSNLHVLNYSIPINETVALPDLQEHLYTLPAQPQLTPYKTSYYQRHWGFCMPQDRYDALQPGKYGVCVNSKIAPGFLTYGELLIPGAREEEVLVSTHVCHPSLANDNLSGIGVTVELAKYLISRSNRYSFRFLFVPGTIGSICWLAQNHAELRKIRCGFVASLLGDNGPFTYKKTRSGNAEIDYLVPYVLAESGYRWQSVEFYPYGYDERQYCSPGINLDVGCLTRSQYGTFPEYHTSADNLDFINQRSLGESFDVYRRVVEHLESSRFLRSKVPNGEPQLGKRGLYDAIGGLRDDIDATMAILWLLSCADGRQSLYAVSRKSGIPVDVLQDIVDVLVEKDLVEDLHAAGKKSNNKNQ